MQVVRASALLALLGVGLSPGPAPAQASPLTAQVDSTADTVGPGPTAAPVVVRGDTLFFIRTGLGAFSPHDRADAIRVRLERAVASHRVGLDSLVLVEEPVATEIRMGSIAILAVTDADAALEGTTRDELARLRGDRIRRTMTQEVAATSLKGLAIGGGLALLATVGLLLLLRVLRGLFTRLHRTAEVLGRRGKTFRIQSLELLSARQMAGLLATVTRALRVVVTLLLIYVYLLVVFSLFPQTRGLAATLLHYVLGPIRQVGEAVISYLPNLFYLAVIVGVLRLLLRIIRMFFQGIERGAIQFRGFYPEWATPTYKIVRFLVLVLGVVVTFPYLPGYQSAAFKGVSVFVAVIFSLGSTGAVSNIVAGVVITYMRSFNLGDRVRISDTVGDVVERTLLVTRVRTIKNVDVTIPNAQILASHIINYSAVAREAGLILNTTVTIGYDAPWAAVHAALIAAARRTEGVEETPEPFVLQTALNDFYVSYEINAYTKLPNRMAGMYSELHQHIQDCFNEAGIEIMSPHYSSLRDGNETTIPADHRPEGYRAPGFRIAPKDG